MSKSSSRRHPITDLVGYGHKTRHSPAIPKLIEFLPEPTKVGEFEVPQFVFRTSTGPDCFFKLSYQSTSSTSGWVMIETLSCPKDPFSCEQIDSVVSALENAFGTEWFPLAYRGRDKTPGLGTAILRVTRGNRELRSLAPYLAVALEDLNLCEWNGQSRRARWRLVGERADLNLVARRVRLAEARKWRLPQPSFGPDSREEWLKTLLHSIFDGVVPDGGYWTPDSAIGQLARWFLDEKGVKDQGHPPTEVLRFVPAPTWRKCYHYAVDLYFKKYFPDKLRSGPLHPEIEGEQIYTMRGRRDSWRKIAETFGYPTDPEN